MASKDSLKTARPIAPLGLVAMKSIDGLGTRTDQYLLEWRADRDLDPKVDLRNPSYEEDNTYVVKTSVPRFGSGEAKGMIMQSVRGLDLYIMTDVTNYNMTYNLCGHENHMSPDDHYADLKRVIAAVEGKARRITVIMPFLYESRQHKRTSRESLDCALALQELVAMGVDNIITFDAHDPRVQNAIPIQGIDNFPTSYQFIKAFIENEPELSFTKESLNIVSPDVGGMSRVVFYSNIMEVNMGMFYRRKNYSITNENGEHPVVAIEFLGGNIKGKDIIIVDDMIDTGKSMINTALELKKRGAAKIIMAATFGLFSQGLDAFDMAYKEGLLDSLYTTNLTYCSEELKAKPYYKLVDMSIPLAKLLDTINYDDSFSKLTNQAALIKQLLKEKKING